MCSVKLYFNMFSKSAANNLDVSDAWMKAKRLHSTIDVTIRLSLLLANSCTRYRPEKSHRRNDILITRKTFIGCKWCVRVNTQVQWALNKCFEFHSFFEHLSGVHTVLWRYIVGLVLNRAFITWAAFFAENAWLERLWTVQDKSRRKQKNSVKVAFFAKV